MKFVFSALAVCLLLTQTASAQTALKAPDKAVLIAKSLTKLDSKGRTLLSKALVGQTYENRVSVMDSKCNYVGRSMIVECEVMIGTDDMMDDDNGWGTVYKLEIRSINNEVTTAKMTLIAG